MAIHLCSVYNTSQHVGKRYSAAVKSMADHGVTDTITCLVPKKEMVWGHKYHGMSDAEYNRQYFSLMSSRWHSLRAWLKSLKSDEDITILCYCGEGKFCHRHLIARIIRRYRPDLVVIVH